MTFIGPSGSHMGHKETVKDTARVLGRMYDAIEYRGFGESIADELAEWAGVPVYNGLTDEWHPTQMLADFLTMREHLTKPLRGDGVLLPRRRALQHGQQLHLAIGAKLGMDVRIAAPKSLWPAQDLVEHGEGLRRRRERRASRSPTTSRRACAAATSCSPTCGSRWASPTTCGPSGSSCSCRTRSTTATMELTGNPEVKFMHCLPAFHNADTEVGKELEQKFGLTALEVTEDVFESPASIVFDEAENRMHTIKAVMVATLGS